MEDKFSERIPDQTSEVEKANDAFKKQREIYVKQILNNPYDPDLCERVRLITVQILEYMGELTIDIFRLHNEMFDFYTTQHPRELGKKLYIDRVDGIHKPYDLIKNRCFKLLDDLEIYVKKKDPNYV